MTTVPDMAERLEEVAREGSFKCGVVTPNRHGGFNFCKRPTQSTTGKGISQAYCKQHVEHLRRHGSAWQKSYSKAELAPFRTAARKWLKQHQNVPLIIRGATELQGLIDASGRAESASQIRWMRPDEKARVALARLREAGKTGWQLLEIVLVVKAAISVIGQRGSTEFLHVQIAKRAHRLASGTHIKSSFWGDSSKYPRPEGGVMRILGSQIERAAAHGIDRWSVKEVVEIAGTL